MDDPAVELDAGEVFAGWRVERELARGGMGVLYLAHHPRLPRTDVIKVLSPWLSEDPRFRDRFLAEAHRMSTLSHPHVMPIHDSGTAANGTLYLVMPYIAGGDLRGLLKRSGRLEPRRASRIVTQLAAALDAAHRIGVVHRDVKPENVMLSSVEPNDPDHVLLTDFGISREELSATTVTATGELLLTPAYAAPEQALGRPVDARADQYALACILVELLTGQPPYEGQAPVVMLMAHVQEPIPQVAARFGLPLQLDGVLARALAKDPAARYGSCREFAQAVRDVLDPATVSVGANAPAVRATLRHSEPPAPVGYATPPPARSRRTLWLAIAGVVVVGAAVAVAVGVSAGSHGKAKTTSTGPFPGAVSSPYSALLTRLPTDVAGSCKDTTAQLAAAEKPDVQTRASCSRSLSGRSLQVSYRTVKGDPSAVTTYRMTVLDLGGNNHHGGDCLTLTPSPGEAVGAVGFAQDRVVGRTPGRLWCSKNATDGAFWFLQDTASPGSLRIMTELETSMPGGVATAQARFADLEALVPVS